MTIDNSNQLDNARDAISKGDKKKAQQILADVLKKDSQNADAWLLLADILDNPEHRIDSLRRVLQINPNNVIAKRRLDELIGGQSKSSNKLRVTPIKSANIPLKAPRKKNNTWIVVFGALLLVACGCVAFFYFLGNMGGSANSTASLPPHVVNDLYDNGNMVDYYIVVDKSFTKDNAMKLITYYQAKHSGYGILNIIFYCDNSYAQEKYLQPNSPIPDSELYKHMLYWYQTGSMSWSGTRFVVDISNPDFTDYPTLGSACK